MPALSYMQRRASGTYEFRKRLPTTLAGKPAPSHLRQALGDLVNPATGCFKHELVRSLATKDVKEAKRRNNREAHLATQLFEAAEQGLIGAPALPLLSTEVLREIEDGWLRELLAADEAERNDGDDRRRFQTAEDRAQWPDLEPAVNLGNGQPRTSSAGLAPDAKGMTVDHHHSYGGALEEFGQEYREAWSRRDPSIVRSETRTSCERNGWPVNEAAPYFRDLGLAILKAHVRAFDLMRQRQEGGVIEIIAPALRPAAPMAATLADRRNRGPKLSEAFQMWAAGGSAKGARKPSARTVSEAEQAVRYFRELHGDMAVGDITRQQARTFRDAIGKVPRGLPRRLRSLPLPLLLREDLKAFQARNATTVNKLVGLVSAVISHVDRDGHVDDVRDFSNPFDKRLRILTEGKESRAIFDKADLQAIFTSSVYSVGARPRGGGGEASFWFPLIGLLSGMRLDEIAQLRICDVRYDEETGRWFFDVGRDGSRNVKTVSSVRRVPLHAELERIGLLRYRQSLLDANANPEGPLWPEVESTPGRPRSAAWSKWFGRYLRNTIGIKSAQKVFHSFRHTFKRMTRDARLPEELHDALSGHAGSGSIGRSYGKGYSLSPLISAVDQLVAPIGLTTVSWIDGRSLPE